MILLACDSGSDKSFDFLGLAKLVEMVKEIILSLWDRVIFFREKQMGERIDLIAKSLPVIERIAAMEQNNQLNREQAEILRRDILSGAGKFISAGAIIPEVEQHSQYNPRQLMAAEPKLLAPPSVVIAEEAEAADAKEEAVVTPSISCDDEELNTDDEELNSEEKKAFEKLFKQMKRKTGKKHTDKPAE